MRYFETGMTDPGPRLPWFFEVVYVDGKIFVHYNLVMLRDGNITWRKPVCSGCGDM